MTRLAMRDLLDYAFLSEPALSPDERQLAFVATRCDEEQNGYHSCIHLLDTGTGEIRQLTSGGKEKSFCFLDSGKVLFSAPPEGETARRAELGEPWTCYRTIALADGEMCEYMRLPKKVSRILPIGEERFLLIADHQLYEPDPHELAGEERERYLRQRKERQESYLTAHEMPFRWEGMGHTDGVRKRLYFYDRRTGQFTPLSDPEQNVEFFDCSEGQVLFTARVFTENAPKFHRSGVYRFDLASGERKRLVEENLFRIKYCGFVGGKPVMVGTDEKRFGYQENPYFYSLEGDRLALLAENQRSVQNAVGTDCRYGGGATWVPYGNDLFFVGTEHGNSLVKRFSPDGTITPCHATEGSVDAFAVGSRGIYFVGMLENRLQELYLLQDGKNERLSSFNDWVTSGCATSVPELTCFTREGVEMEGYVIRPVGWRPEERYPAILYLHGGHKLTYGPVFNHEMQLWANEGYYVLYCNPRGSDGWDNEFADIIGKYGFLDGEDILAFLDRCLELHPDIDPARVGVGGGSYGGFMTNWLIGHTTRFRCAVSQRGIANYLSMFGTSDTSYRFPMWDFDTDIWMDAGRYWEHSPLKYADRVETPTLFIHSENDCRCPVSEGIQMFYALKYRGVPAKLCIFKGEGHELSRGGKPKNRLNRLLEITEWWNQYLK